MIYYDIFDGAIAAVCEDVASLQGNDDYYNRAGYSMPIFVRQHAELDNLVRASKGMGPNDIPPDQCAVDPDSDFPLCDIFIPAAIYYLSSAMVLDENEEMSDKFFDRYITAIMDIRNAIPAKQAPIIDRYGVN